MSVTESRLDLREAAEPLEVGREGSWGPEISAKVEQLLAQLPESLPERVAAICGSMAGAGAGSVDDFLREKHAERDAEYGR